VLNLGDRRCSGAGKHVLAKLWHCAYIMRMSFTENENDKGPKVVAKVNMAYGPLYAISYCLILIDAVANGAAP